MPESEYGRGLRQGRVDQELHAHAEHLRKINGSMETVAKQLGIMTDQFSKLLQAIARIDQTITADKETVRVTAEALRDQVDAASSRDTQRWTPFNRAMVAVAGFASAAGAVYLLFH